MGARGGREGERGKGEGGRAGNRGEGVVNGARAGNLKLVPKIVLAGGGSSRNRSSHPASKSTRQGSNLRPGDLQSLALPLSYWWLTKRGEKTIVTTLLAGARRPLQSQ